MVHVNSPQDAAALLGGAAPGRHVAVIGPPGSGKTCVLASVVIDALNCGTALPALTMFAPTRASARRLRDLVAAAWPALDPRDMFHYGEGFGTPIDAASAHSWVRHERRVDGRDITAAAAGYADLIRIVGEIAEDDAAGQTFLAARRADIAAAIRFDIDRRLKGEPLPRLAWLHEIADFFHAFKARHALADAADLYAALCPDERVELLVMDECEPRDRAMLARAFPRATTVTASRAPIDADLAVTLPRCLREPERWDIEDETGRISLVPFNAVEGSLMIVLSHRAAWRLPGWRRWCDDGGFYARIFNGPDSDGWRAIVAAWQIDQGGEADAGQVVPLLKAAGLKPYFDEGCRLTRDDIPGFTTWHELARHAHPRDRARAESVLGHYGRLSDLPHHRIVTAKQARGREADTVIVDRCSGAFANDDELATAMSRARRKLIVIKKPERA